MKRVNFPLIGGSRNGQTVELEQDRMPTIVDYGNERYRLARKWVEWRYVLERKRRLARRRGKR